MPYMIFKDYPKKKYKCSIRLVRICKDNRLNRLADFSRMSFRDVLSLPECGMKTAVHVRKILKENGLDFCKKSCSVRGKNLTQRNELIHQMISSGQSYRKIGGKMGISAARVAQIYKERRLERRREIRV